MDAPPSPPKISLELSQTSSILHGLELIEYFGNDQKNKVMKLINSSVLADKWNNKNYMQTQSSQLWKNERHQLQNYYKNYNKKHDGFIVKYSRHKQKYGRVYPCQSLGLSSMAQATRNTLIKDLYYDFDLSNAQPAIIKNICESNNIECSTIKYYCENQAQIKKDLSKELNCDETDIKKLFIRLAFFGSFNNWAIDNNIEYEKIPDIVSNYIQELKNISLLLKSKNPVLHKIVYDQKTEKNESNIIGSFFSKYLQEYELRIVESVLEWLFNETEICNSKDPLMKIATYEYDGIKLLKKNIDKWGSIDDFCNKLNEITFKKTGFAMKWVNKPIDKVLDIKFDNNIFENSYNSKKIEWEEKFCKILDSGEYIEKNGNEIIIKTRKNLLDSYEHECCGIDENGKNIQFLNIWLKDPNIRKYKKRESHPNPKKCPDDVFNMWVDFEMENIDEYEHKEEELQFILNHIKILCGHEQEIYEYFLMWMAHMVQFPEIKSICPTLISTEGGGKTTLIDLLTKMMGHKKVLMTSKPEQQVWGTFNNMMMDSFLVNLNEVNLGNSYNAENNIKQLITDPTITINIKGISEFTMKSYHRFIATTNNPDGFFKTTRKDRRNLVIRSSDELVNNFSYFKKINQLIDDVNVVKTFYEYLKKMENIPEKLDTPPKTEHQTSLFEMNESPIEQFIKNMTREYLYQRYATDKNDKSPHIVELYPNEIFKMFQVWLMTTKMKYEMNSIKFGIAIKNLKIDGIEKGRHTNIGTSKIFNIDKLKKHFGLENMEFVDDED
jgi:hypothetical protein